MYCSRNSKYSFFLWEKIHLDSHETSSGKKVVEMLYLKIYNNGFHMIPRLEKYRKNLTFFLGSLFCFPFLCFLNSLSWKETLFSSPHYKNSSRSTVTNCSEFLPEPLMHSSSQKRFRHITFVQEWSSIHAIENRASLYPSFDHPLELFPWLERKDREGKPKNFEDIANEGIMLRKT